MSDDVSRRSFLQKTAAVSALGFGFEDKILLARAKDAPKDQAPPMPLGTMPSGKIKKLQISRIICGGNLISGHAHSRDLIYVSDLLRTYFTDDKVMETFAQCEQNGINTAILRLDERTLRILQIYRKRTCGSHAVDRPN